MRSSTLAGSLVFLVMASSEAAVLASPPWMSVAPMAEARSHHTATLLQNGKVLVVGAGARSRRAQPLRAG